MARDKPNYAVDRSSELPLGAQLAGRIRGLVGGGELAAGERLPSVRELAELAGVNVNTVRSVYGRLEEEGIVRSEQGRGTFVATDAARKSAARAAAVPRGEAAAGEGADRAALRREIVRLEAELARRPRPPSAPDPGVFERGGQGGTGHAGGLLSAAELQRVHDSLRERLGELEDARSEVVRALERLDAAERAEAAADPTVAAPPEPQPGSRSASTLGGVRVRWVGGA